MKRDWMQSTASSTSGSSSSASRCARSRFVSRLAGPAEGDASSARGSPVMRATCKRRRQRAKQVGQSWDRLAETSCRWIAAPVPVMPLAHQQVTETEPALAGLRNISVVGRQAAAEVPQGGVDARVADPDAFPRAGPRAAFLGDACAPLHYIYIYICIYIYTEATHVR